MWRKDLMDETPDTLRMLVPMLTMTAAVSMGMGIVVSVCAGVTHCGPTFPALRLETGLLVLRVRANCTMRSTRTHFASLRHGNISACIRR
jgi:hypothetical protein